MQGHGLRGELLHAASFWLKNFKLSVPVYLPVFATTTLIFNSKKVLAQPAQSTRHYLSR